MKVVEYFSTSVYEFDDGVLFEVGFDDLGEVASFGKFGDEIVFSVLGLEDVYDFEDEFPIPVFMVGF